MSFFAISNFHWPNLVEAYKEKFILGIHFAIEAA